MLTLNSKIASNQMLNLSDIKNMSINLLKEIANKTINNAGPRYTPNIDESAPNLEIKSLIDAIECLVRGENLSCLFRKFLDGINAIFVLDEEWFNK